MHKFGVRLLKNKLHPINVPETVTLHHDDMVLVRTEKGEEVAKAQRIPCCVFKKWGNKLPESVPLIRVLSGYDMNTVKEIEAKNKEAYKECQELIKKHKLVMDLVDTRFTFDQRKVTFYFTAPSRVDFRGLLRDLTQTFRRVRIDLRHIGVRDETAIMDGCGLCGKSFCCSNWLDKFESINLKLAKDQGMPITPTKISGVCGRLLCCLNYEYQNYIDAAAGMPPIGSGVMTPEGIGRVCSLHFLNDKLQVKLEDGKMMDFAKDQIEMIDGEVSNIEISVPHRHHIEEDSTENVKDLEDDRNSSTGNV